MSDLVYHYCSLDSFIKIVEGKSLKFSDIKKSNDNKEVEFLWQCYLDYIEKNSKNNPCVNSSIHFFKEEQMKTTDFLVCCFSKCNDAVHLWNCYANKGVAIGFKRDDLVEWSKGISFFNNDIYCSDDNVDGIAVCGDIIYYDKSNIESFIEKQCNGIDLIVNNFQYIFNWAPFHKTDFWKEEQEWRIVLPIIYSEKADFSKVPDYIEKPNIIKIKAAPDLQFGFKLYCLIPFETSAIEEIVLAPNCKANVSDIIKILKANGFYLTEDQIIKSNGSLR